MVQSMIAIQIIGFQPAQFVLNTVIKMMDLLGEMIDRKTVHIVILTGDKYMLYMVVGWI